MEDLFGRVTKGLVQDEPSSKGLRFAAVSMMVHDRARPSVLLIKRADQEGDPWSGQIAFPGGKTQPGDKSARDTAIRETREEVGVDLGRDGSFLGYGTVTTTHTGTMDVVPTVFELKQRADVTPNGEVASYRWVELRELLSSAAQFSYRLNFRGNDVVMPAYKVGDYVVWGLTYRILSTMLAVPH